MFVAQHLEDPVLRSKTIEGIVCRQCSFAEDLTDQEDFLINQLHISCEIVYQAKVSSFLCCHSNSFEIQYLFW